MKKSLIKTVILLLLISTLGYFIYDAKIQKDNFFIVDNNIEKINMLNKDFDMYTHNSFSYDNFDIIENKINSFEEQLNSIKSNKILKKIKNKKLETILNELETTAEIKFKILNRIKSYRAILNNSFRIIQKIKKQEISNNFNNLYTIIMTIDKNPELNIKQEINHIKKIIPLYDNKYERNFLLHTKTILTYYLKFTNINNKLEELQIENKLYDLNIIYENYSQDSIKKAQFAISVLFILLGISIIFYLIYEYKLVKSNKELSKFRSTVENSDNIVVITDENEIIKYVNDAFTKSTGYTSAEVVGKKPSILKSGQQSKSFYKELHKTIYSGKKWSGEFINFDKNGELSYEKASIMPVIGDDGKIEEFISMKLDITNETINSKKLKEKEKLLIQQSKMASMGEMLENIAHQWRQPLSAISTASTGLRVQKELGLEISTQEDIEILNKINETAQHLSETINNFRDFFKPNKQKEIFNLKNTYIKTLNLVNSKFKSLNIEVIENLEDIELNTLDNEVVQIIMNLFNNARDVLETKENQERLIFVDIYKDKDYAILSIKDNAGGIPDNIIDKVFDPYFTTKHQSQGTGIGLYMSQEMISKHLKGTLTVENVTFTYKNHQYTGAQFIISLPL